MEIFKIEIIAMKEFSVAYRRRQLEGEFTRAAIKAFRDDDLVLDHPAFMKLGEAVAIFVIIIDAVIEKLVLDLQPVVGGVDHVEIGGLGLVHQQIILAGQHFLPAELCRADVGKPKPGIVGRIAGVIIGRVGKDAAAATTEGTERVEIADRLAAFGAGATPFL